METYYSKNREKILKNSKVYYANNRQRVIDKVILYRKEHKEEIKIKRKEKIRIYSSLYYMKNRKKIIAGKNIYRKKRAAEDINFSIASALRVRLWRTVRGGYKAGSAIKELGCSVDFFKKHIESLFQEGMSWDNWGVKGWHIDHIRPLSSFDLTNREEFLVACHYTNMQPLWAVDNLRKGNLIVL